MSVNPTSNYGNYNAAVNNNQQRNTGMELGTDTFLQLLITQMRYQDPFAGGQDMGEFMTQITQFTMLERIIKLQQSMDAFAEQHGYTQALNLLNKNVEISSNGLLIIGEVTSVRFEGGQPMLRVGDFDFPLNSVISVK